MTKINSFSDLFEAIQNDSIEFKDALEYILARESDSFNRGYTAAKSLYEPLAFPDNTVA